MFLSPLTLDSGTTQKIHKFLSMSVCGNAKESSVRRFFLSNLLFPVSALLDLAFSPTNLSGTRSKIFLRPSHALKFSVVHQTWLLGHLVISLHGMNHHSDQPSLVLFWVCGWDSFPGPIYCIALTIEWHLSLSAQSFQSLTAMPVCSRVTKIHPASFISSTKAGADTEEETNSVVSDEWDAGLLHSPNDLLLIDFHIQPLIEIAAELLKPKETSKTVALVHLYRQNILSQKTYQEGK